MLHIKEAILVEGLYDKQRLKNIVDTCIITTDGFAVYKDKEKLALIRRMARERGLIILTDSDSAGKRIRNYIKSCTGGLDVKHAYIPQIEGKEKRKDKAGAEGILGVEGMTEETLTHVLTRAGCMPMQGEKRTEITKLHLFQDGLTGGSGSAQKRGALLRHLNFPSNISCNGLIEILNAFYSLDEYRDVIKKLKIIE
ncbi:MAG: DUF4093 domain-containing protein [Eubacteriales bacterium]|nr:DUF4093 domain-containing protein [Eubacteriales bacterium]